MTNEERAGYGIKALESGCSDQHEDKQTILSDTLANLRHAAASCGLNFDRANAMAELNFKSEADEYTDEVDPLHKGTAQETSTATRVMVVIEGGICQDVIELTPIELGFQYLIKDWDNIKEEGEAQDFYDTYRDDPDARIILKGINPSSECLNITAK